MCCRTVCGTTETREAYPSVKKEERESFRIIIPEKKTSKAKKENTFNIIQKCGRGYTELIILYIWDLDITP